MEVFGLLLIVGIYAIIIVVLYTIIRVATKSDSLNKEALRQSLFLEAMARYQGVPEDELEAINRSVDKVTQKNQ